MHWKKIRSIVLRYKWRLTILLAASALYAFALPDTLFRDPYSTVLLARNGELLSASIAQDGQWRFPVSASIPDKFAEALITFEDKRFRYHPGVDILSMGRALVQNISHQKIVSGGSTISMQVIRLSRKHKPRTVLEKLYEVILATRLEVRHSKAEILEMYAAHAPFGGNVVGLEAACWRYFGTDARDLSWAQAALLAVLPNSPSLIHPGKNRTRLKQKRDSLLDKLLREGTIDAFTCALSKEEPLPEAPFPLPRHARHLLVRAAKEKFSQQKLVSSIDYDLQLRVEQILADHHRRLAGNHIYNGAVIVLDVRTGQVLSYVGNTTSGAAHDQEVDIIVSPRSTGSILKPFLYAAMLDEGKILPKTLLPDIPVLINGFAPKNFSHDYDGAVAADKALIRSLNVPAVHMLREYRYEKFYTLLKEVGMTTLHGPADHYGLSLILGGAEGTLWDITGMYASMARSLDTYFQYPGRERYRESDFHEPVFVKDATIKASDPGEASILSASSIYFTFESLKEVYRPGEETGWRYFGNAKNIAWKTGTSFGFRDGWAVGLTHDFAVGVWIGNADGEGRPGLTGTDAAAPVMFDIFALLPRNKAWFNVPFPETREVVLCAASGHRASDVCTKTDTVLVPSTGLGTPQCPYHRRVHLSADLKYQVHDKCAPLATMKHLNWFVLPPVQEFYYKSMHHDYRPLPAFRNDCENSQGIVSMDLVYPKNNTKLFIPRELDGEAGRSVFELAHRDPQATVFWHLDGKFVGSTSKVHHLALNPGPGKHKLTLVDGEGIEIRRDFEVISGL